MIVVLLHCVWSIWSYVSRVARVAWMLTYVKFKRFVSHGSGPCVVVIEQVGSFNRVPQADIPALICRR